MSDSKTGSKSDLNESNMPLLDDDQTEKAGETPEASSKEGSKEDSSKEGSQKASSKEGKEASSKETSCKEGKEAQEGQEASTKKSKEAQEEEGTKEGQRCTKTGNVRFLLVCSR